MSTSTGTRRDAADTAEAAGAIGDGVVTGGGAAGAIGDGVVTGGGAAGAIGDAAVTIRAATPGDAPTIRDLAGLSASTLRLLDHDLAQPDRRCLVATVGPEDAADPSARTATGHLDGGGRSVVGYAAAILQHTDAHVIDIAVDPTCRRRRIGRRLLDALVVSVLDAGADAVTLEVRASNLGSQALYRQVGFVDVGRRPRYYPDGEDALIWWLRPDGTSTHGTDPDDPRPDDAEEVD